MAYRLKPDGLLEPAGPTIETIRRAHARLLGPPVPVPRGALPEPEDDAAASKRRTVDGMRGTGNLGAIPKYVAEVYRNGGVQGRANLDDFLAQLKKRDPEKVPELFRATNWLLEGLGAEPLDAAGFSSLARKANDKAEPGRGNEDRSDPDVRDTESGGYGRWRVVETRSAADGR